MASLDVLASLKEILITRIERIVHPIDIPIFYSNIMMVIASPYYLPHSLKPDYSTNRVAGVRCCEEGRCVGDRYEEVLPEGVHSRNSVRVAEVLHTDHGLADGKLG